MAEKIIDFDNMKEKRDFMVMAGGWHGKKRVEFCNYAPRRSDRQLRYYWPCVIAPFALWLHEENGEKYDEDAAHEILKAEYLTVAIVNKETGERLGRRIRSTGELDTYQFFLYVEECRDHLAKYCHILTEDPDPNHATNSRKERVSA